MICIKSISHGEIQFGVCTTFDRFYFASNETGSPTTTMVIQASNIIPIIATIFAIVGDIVNVIDIKHQTMDTNVSQLSILLF